MSARISYPDMQCIYTMLLCHFPCFSCSTHRCCWRTLKPVSLNHLSSRANAQSLGSSDVSNVNYCIVITGINVSYSPLQSSMTFFPVLHSHSFSSVFFTFFSVFSFFGFFSTFTSSFLISFSLTSFFSSTNLSGCFSFFNGDLSEKIILFSSAKGTMYEGELIL